jgi:hypothetical protein
MSEVLTECSDKIGTLIKILNNIELLYPSHHPRVKLLKQ